MTSLWLHRYAFFPGKNQVLQSDNSQFNSLRHKINFNINNYSNKKS